MSSATHERRGQLDLRKICILGLDDYAMLTGNTAFGHIGGESVQHVLLARAWRDLGFEVSIVVYDHGQPRVTDIDGIRAVASYRIQDGLPGLRFFTRLASVIRAMERVDADIYYQSPAGMLTGVAAWFARRKRKKVVVRIASDLGCIPGAQLMPYARDRKMYEYGLRRADLVAAQTHHQQQLLRQNYGLRSEIVNMLVEIPPVAASVERDIDVLWVGNLRPVKRPEIIFELARALPKRRFVVAGGALPRQREYFDEMKARARELPNVEMLGSVSYEAVGPLFERAKVHINTSSAEGFPNTFLQAWARRIPVVSFFDPDNLIERRGFGRRCGSVEEMVSALDSLLDDEARREEIGSRARDFVESEFSPRAIATRYLDLLAGAHAPEHLSQRRREAEVGEEGI
jgi:glycosyltransferase involved in cell wall biosynthesis